MVGHRIHGIALLASPSSVLLILFVIIILITVDIVLLVVVIILEIVLLLFLLKILIKLWATSRSLSCSGPCLLSEKILWQLHVELDVLSFEVLIRWHPELELMVNVKVDIIFISLRYLFSHQIYPRIIWLPRSLFYGFFGRSRLFVLLSDLEQIFERARDQIVFRYVLLIVCPILVMIISAVEWCTEIVVFSPSTLLIILIYFERLCLSRLHAGMSALFLGLLWLSLLVVGLLAVKINFLVSFPLNALLILFPLLAPAVLLPLLLIECSLFPFVNPLFVPVFLFHHGTIGLFLTPRLLFVISAPLFALLTILIALPVTMLSIGHILVLLKPTC